MLRRRHRLFLGATILLAACCARGLAQQPGPPQPAPPPGEIGAPAAEASAFPPPTDLNDALNRALNAVREAEKRDAMTPLRMQEALFYVREAFKLDQVNAKAEYISGRLNLLAGRSRDAFGQIEAYVRTPEGAKDWEAWKVLGDLHYAGQYYVLADQKYRRAVTLNPNEASIYVGLCRSAGKQARKQEAVELGARAAQLDPQSAEAREVYALALAAREQLPEATEAMKACLGLTQRELGNDLTNTSILTKLLDRYGKLLEILQAAIARRPASPAEFPEFADNLVAFTRVNLEKYELERHLRLLQLSTTIRQAIDFMAPNTPPALFHEYVTLLVHSGQTENARQVLERLLQANPEDTVSRQMLEALKAGAAPSAPRPGPQQPPAGGQPASGPPQQ